MHRQLGTDMQVKGIPNGKHQQDLQGPHSCVFALPRPGILLLFPVPQPREPVTWTESVSALHFSAVQWILQGVSCRSC